MLRRKLGSAVVVDGEQVVGVFTTIDALRALTELLERE
jgi:acetoin utilization protein AcuB